MHPVRIVTLLNNRAEISELLCQSYVPGAKLRKQLNKALTDLLLMVIAECEEELEQGSAITVEPSRIHIRRLPLIPDV